jgi:hypothetical protein
MPKAYDKAERGRGRTERRTLKTSIAAALRYHARRPSRPLQTIMNC